MKGAKPCMLVLAAVVLLAAGPAGALSVDQVIALRKAGVSNETIQQMIDTEMRVRAMGGTGRYVVRQGNGREMIVYQAKSTSGVVDYPVPVDQGGGRVSGLATVLGAPAQVSQALPHSRGSTVVVPSGSVAVGGGGGWTIHTDSYRKPEYARRRLAELRAKGVKARLAGVDIPGKGHWQRVLVGSFASKAQAKEKARQLKAAGSIGSYQVIRR